MTSKRKHETWDADQREDEEPQRVANLNLRTKGTTMFDDLPKTKETARLKDKFLRLTELTIQNVKRVEAVHIRPGDGNLIQICGDNAAGKSSVLDSIEMLLCGTRSVCPEPVRRGEDHAVVCGNVGEFVVTRHFYADKDGKALRTTLEMRSPHGAKIPAPQSVLDSIVGNLAFDPMKFLRMAPKEQGAILRDAAGLDFTKLDESRKKLFDGRTNLNRDLKAAESRLATMEEFPADTPDEEVNIEALTQEMTAAMKFASDRELHVRRLKDRRDEVDRLSRALQLANEAAEEQQHRLRDLPEETDLLPIRSRLQNAETVNISVRAKLAREQQSKSVEDLRIKSEALTVGIAGVDEVRKAAVAEAKMPLPGMGFDEDGNMTYNGLPLVQAAHSEKLRVVTALAMADNPRLRLMRIYDGSLLDSGGVEMMQQLADEHDIQVWIERVGKEGSGIIIEDGKIAAGPEGGGTDG